MNEVQKVNTPAISPKIFKNVFQEVLPEANFNQELQKAMQNQQEKARVIQDTALPNRMAYLVAQTNIQNPNALDMLERRRREDIQQNNFPNLNSAENKSFLNERLEKTPFQVFIDKAVESLEDISAMEFKVNDLIEGHIKGEVSIDEVSIETSKLNLAMSFVTTVLSSATQTFKELTQMAV